MQKVHEGLIKIFESKVLVGVLYGIGVAIILILVFSAGISVGFRKASFDRAWEENYQNNFGMPSGHPGFGGDNFPNAHGAIGKIIKIELPTIIVADQDNTEKVISMTDDTKIEKTGMAITSDKLSIGDFIIVIGSPDDKGQIEAKFIRVMPAGLPPLEAPTQ